MGCGDSAALDRLHWAPASFLEPDDVHETQRRDRGRLCRTELLRDSCTWSHARLDHVLRLSTREPALESVFSVATFVSRARSVELTCQAETGGHAEELRTKVLPLPGHGRGASRTRPADDHGPERAGNPYLQTWRPRRSAG
jgi:hypothetical protein